MVAKCFFLCLTIVHFFGSYHASLCFKTKSEWENACTKIFNGVTDGGRCFFAVNNMTHWADSWKTCVNLGGSLTQIHTKSEFMRIAQYLQSYFNVAGHMQYDPVWLAMQRNISSSTSQCALDLQKSFWYTSATNYDPKFQAGNTWIRNRIKDDCAITGPCEVLWNDNGQYLFGDQLCSNQFYYRPLCVVSNPNQNFTLFQNACIDEQVMETFSTINVESCGRKCISFSWCRGFNFWNNKNTCELFPWSLGDVDTGNKPKSSPAADCYAYSYLP